MLLYTNDPEFLARLRLEEELGLSYVHTVQIDFPTQVKAATGRDGLIVPIRDILLWLAKEDQVAAPYNAMELRMIADHYYPADEDDLCLDDLGDDMRFIEVSPRRGETYTVDYTIKDGAIHPQAQGFAGKPFEIGLLSERDAAASAAHAMIAEFPLKPDTLEFVSCR